MTNRDIIRELVIFFPFLALAELIGLSNSYGFDWKSLFGMIIFAYGGVLFLRGCWYLWKTRSRER